VNNCLQNVLNILSSGSSRTCKIHILQAIDWKSFKLHTMKTISILGLYLLSVNLFSQELPEKEIKSEVNEVTVFLDGAQITRKKAVDLAKGKTIVRFVNLSPFIDAKSVQVKAEGELTVLSVNHQQNYLDKMEKSRELTALEAKLETVDEKITVENTYVSIIREDILFLQTNRNIGGKNEQVSVNNLQLASDFFSKKLTSLKMDEIEHGKTLRDLNEQRNKLQNQINTLSGKKEYPAGEILVKVDAGRSGSFNLELSYMVAYAGWFPSYDVRAVNINEPVQLIYKANVKQDTKVDWTGVKLRFSSADPNVSGIAPQLQTYYLNYNTAPPVYKNLSTNSVRGKVIGTNGEPLPGVNVVVEGTTIGAVTDMEGNYSITIPNGSSQLSFSYIGYASRTLPVSSAVMNVALQEDITSLDEVVITGYAGDEPPMAVREKAANRTAAATTLNIRGVESRPVPAVQVENQTTVDFEINTPYTVLSDNKNYSVDMTYYELPAFYQYFSVPKIDKAAFLMANVVDWEKYNLLEGEANVFFEDTYLGKTLMDVRYASDTLEISLGRDRSISVNREKILDFTNRKFIGNRKEETRAWRITVKNNKNQEVNMIVLDQVPVSTNQEIEVDVQNISGAKHDPQTGEVMWELKLMPSETRELELKYSVKYPRNRNLIIE
jgi:hypothetical protein